MLIEQVKTLVTNVLGKEQPAPRRRLAASSDAARAEGEPLPLGIAIAAALTALGDLLVALKAAKKRHERKKGSSSRSKGARRTTGRARGTA